MEKEATEVLLEMLAGESEKMIKLSRKILLDLLRDIGKNQTALMADYLSEKNTLLVSDIIGILSGIKSDQALLALQKAVGHKNPRIRQEVIKGLLAIGGKKAAGILAEFLKDKDENVQMTAIRGFAGINGSSEDVKPLITFLRNRPLQKKGHTLTLEAIKTLGKVGGSSATDILKTYAEFHWWKPWQLQKELKAAAMKALDEIQRRKGNGGSAKRQPQ